MFHKPTKIDIYSSIKQTIENMLNPPISNLCVKGIRRSAKEIQKWLNLFSDNDLRMNLFSLYIFIEIGGTGGGYFRYMYSRFLRESANILKNNNLDKAAFMINESGKFFTELGLLFKDAETTSDIEQRIKKAQELFNLIADKEKETYHLLSEIIK
jgi:hypothetical protein